MKKKIALVALAIVLLTCLLAVNQSFALVTGRAYTLDADFDEGVLVGVEHETVHDQLQLSTEVTTFPFIWVPNNEGTVSKIDTETGNELGRYWVSSGGDSSPSRTTVDLLGSCWVGCRQRGTVVKIGLFEAGQWIDRNSDGVCQTSQDANSDGDITGAEILPWGQDECVLHEVVLVPGFVGTYVPGTFNPANYDYNYWGVSPRGFAIDSSNNLWAGTWSTSRYYYVDGTTGAIIGSVDVSPHNVYGAALDRNGILWSAEGPGGDQDNIILRLDTATDAISFHDLGHTCYGLGLDYNNHLWISSYWSNRMSRLDILTNPPTFITYDAPEQIGSRGVAATSDNNVWVANTDGYSVTRYDNDGNLLATITTLSGPTGVSVDAEGKVWSTDNYDEYIHRIDPTTNMIELSKQIIGSGGHYTYSDMTGIVARTITTLTGTWTVVFDSEEEDTPWGMISWTSLEPEGTSVTVRVRSSNDEATWSSWETATNGIPLSATPDGRYLQVEATLRIVEGEVSPILYDLTVRTGMLPVFVDIKPGSWPNPINVGGKGTFAVAICGTEDFDVMTIDPATVKIFVEGIAEGVSPLRWSYEDAATPYIGEPGGGHALKGDGYLDLVLHYDTQAVVTVLTLTGHVGEIVPLMIRGNLKEELDGTPIQGQDFVRILAPKR